jgi:hypothetical protein
MTLRRAIHFYFRAKTKYKIHSPLLFSFCEKVLDNQLFYYAYLKFSDQNPQDKHSNISQNWSQWKARVLFRISQWYQADKVLISKQLHSAYTDAITLGNQDAIIFKAKNIAELSKEYSSKQKDILEKKNKKMLYSSIISDAKNHPDCLDQIKKESLEFLVIFTDIHRDNQNYRIWNKLSKQHNDLLCIELWQIGIVIGSSVLTYGSYTVLIPYRWKPFQVY